MRILTIGLAVILIVSCAAILITPDPTDDVDGIMLQHNPFHGHSFAVVVPALLAVFVLPTFPSFRAVIASPRSKTGNVLDVICVRLC